MSRILVIRNDELDPHVSVADCITPVEQSFAALTEGRAQLPTKYHDRTDVGMWFFMGGHMGAENAMAVKLGCATDNTLFMVSENDNAVVNDSNAWFSTNGGVNWTRAFTANWATAGTGIVAYTPDFTVGSTAGSVYVAETGNTALDVWISSDGGNSWSARTAAST